MIQRRHRSATGGRPGEGIDVAVIRPRLDLRNRLFLCYLLVAHLRPDHLRRLLANPCVLSFVLCLPCRRTVPGDVRRNLGPFAATIWAARIPRRAARLGVYGVSEVLDHRE